MSLRDGKDYLYLIWKSGQSGQQYIVGQLTRNSRYEFRYCDEVRNAIEDGFVPLLCFPDLDKQYEDEKLFSVFSSRLPDKKRKNIKDILKKYGLEDYDEYTLLKRSIFLKRDSENKHDANAVQMLDYSGKIIGYIPRYYSSSVAELLEAKKKISCHVYNVDKSKNCNECIKVIMEIWS